MLLAEKFLVLLIDEETGKMKIPFFYRFAYTGAVIIELLNLKKITLEKKRFKVLVHSQDASPTGSKPLDYVLNEISNSKSKSLEKWIRKLCSSTDLIIEKLLFESMKNKGIIRDIIKKAHFWIFVKTEYPLTNPGIKKEIQEEIREGIATEAQPSQTALALLSLMYATWTTKKIIRKEYRKAAHKKTKKLFAKRDKSLIKEYSENIYYVAKEIRNLVAYAYA